MATVTKRNKSYLFRCYSGYDAEGKQIEHTKTWKPPALNPDTGRPYTAKAAEKEANRRAALFEEEIKTGTAVNGNIRFNDYADRWLKDYAEKSVKTRTYQRYKDMLRRLRQEFGNMRMEQIRPAHINAYYAKLGEPVKVIGYKCNTDLLKLIKQSNMTQKVFIEKSGISTHYLRKLRSGGEVDIDIARKVSDAFGLSVSDIFEEVTREHTLSDSTIHRYHELLSVMFAWAVKWEIMKYNPCERTIPPKRKKTDAVYLQNEDVESLFNALDDMEQSATDAALFTVRTHKTAVQMLLFTGARRGEILGLKWSDVDFENNTISFSRTVLYTAETGVFIDTPKNETSARVIRISENVMDILKKYKVYQASERLQLGSAWTDNDWIFAMRTGEVLRPDVITNWFKQVIKKYDLPDVHLHSLRHTNASILIAAGNNLQTVASRLGHADTTTTAKIYAHAIAEAEAAAVESLDNVFFKKKA